MGLLTNDVEWIVHGPFADGVYQGYDGVRKFFSMLKPITDMKAFQPDFDSFFCDPTKQVVHRLGVEQGLLKSEHDRKYLNNFDHTFWFKSSTKKDQHARGIGVPVVYKVRINWNATKPP